MKEAEVKRIIYHYGKEAQKDVAVEEMAELTKELMKERRGACNTNAILEEIADVSVMLHQLLMIYNFTEEDVNRIAEEKIERQLKRIENIEQEPTVDAEPVRHGKWLFIRMDEDGNGLYECSLCHKGETHVPQVKVNYCWNCGAKMDGEERWK